MITPDQQQLFDEWTTSSRLLFYSIICISSITLPILLIILVLIKPHRCSQYYPYMCAIILGNFVLLCTVFILVITENIDVIHDYFPGFLVCKFSVFIVNTSSCFIHWTWVAMYSQRFLHVFFPIHFRRSMPRSSWNTLLLILLLSLLVQSWVPLTITELNYSQGSEGTYCAAHPYFQGFSKTIVLIESTVAFFIPFFLTVSADVSVLILRTSLHTTFKLISTDDLRRNNRSDTMKIVSKLNLESTEKRRSKAIKRCLISATVTLLLNLPNYVLQVTDEFYSLGNSPDISVRRFFITVDAFVYILYLLQFPLVPLNMFFLRQNITRSSRKLREKGTFQIEQSRSLQLIDMSNDQSRTLLSSTIQTIA